jgi:transposase-like protein
VVAQKPVNADGLTAKQVIAADAIVAGKTMTDAAQAAGVTNKTLWSWRHTPQFMSVVNRKLQERTDVAGTQGVGLVPECLTVLKGIMNNPMSENTDRIRAAKAIMDSANAYYERRELEITISRLERRIMILTSATTNAAEAQYHLMEAAQDEDAGDDKAETFQVVDIQ